MRRKAASWLAKLEGDDPEAVQPAFERWYQADPRHAEAFDRVRHYYSQMGLLRNLPRAPEPLPERRGDAVPSQRRHALAAALAAAVLIPAAVLTTSRLSPPAATQALLLSTQIGEIREVPLADGSKVTLDTQSSVRVEISRDRRSATLERGRARFSVAAADMPFVIRSGSATIASNGGVMDVAREPQGERLDLIAGTARIAAEAPDLQAPVTVVNPGAPTQRLLGATRDSDWPSGRLEFQSMTLYQAVAVANRYSSRKIVLTDPAAKTLRATGVFKAGDTPQLARSLARAFQLELREDPSGNLLLEASGQPHHKKNGG